jgi:hypothetical protein
MVLAVAPGRSGGQEGVALGETGAAVVVPAAQESPGHEHQRHDDRLVGPGRGPGRVAADTAWDGPRAVRHGGHMPSVAPQRGQRGDGSRVKTVVPQTLHSTSRGGSQSESHAVIRRPPRSAR